MITRKTAVLLAACCELGALAGGANAQDAQAMYEFGLHVGISFQMQDDILGIWGSAAVTGKPDAADLLRRKLSLPVIYTLAKEPTDGALHALYATPAGDDAGLAAALTAMDAYGARAMVAAQAQAHYELACAALARVNVRNEATRLAMQQLADQLLGRQS
jgi:geranylgeranyl diphosphate synthase type I